MQSDLKPPRRLAGVAPHISYAGFTWIVTCACQGGIERGSLPQQSLCAKNSAAGVEPAYVLNLSAGCFRTGWRIREYTARQGVR